MLLKNGRTIYYGSVVWFKENIFPQLAESAFDSVGDRIIDHITTYDDLFVPENHTDDTITPLITSETLKLEFLLSTSERNSLRL